MDRAGAGYLPLLDYELIRPFKKARGLCIRDAVEAFLTWEEDLCISDPAVIIPEVDTT